jgi:hypothetical protein
MLCAGRGWLFGVTDIRHGSPFVRPSPCLLPFKLFGAKVLQQCHDAPSNLSMKSAPFMRFAFPRIAQTVPKPALVALLYPRAPASPISSNSTMTLALPFSTILPSTRTSDSSSAPAPTPLSRTPASASPVTAWLGRVSHYSVRSIVVYHNAILLDDPISKLPSPKGYLDKFTDVAKGYNTTPASSRRKTEGRAYA